VIIISLDSSFDLESTYGPSSFDFSSYNSCGEIVYSSPDILGGKKTKASGLSNSKAKSFFSSISMAKSSILSKASGSSSSKAKALGSSHQTVLVKSPIPIRNYILGLANGRT
ncbi:hypothetical protein Tco_1480200, partial [Tanacetum coccineum]